MKREPIFLEPVFKERIWGGTALADGFGYSIPSQRTGECWAISGHRNGASIVRSGEYQGISLDQLWNTHPLLFGHYPSDSFPLLTKILDANEDLSVQVHPDDEYATLNEDGEKGKTECWYILDCREGAELVLGHYAQTKEELLERVALGQWDQLLRRIPIHPGDFFYVPSGTVHALCAGTLVLETQQSSDTTYRLYDYDRLDHAGNSRELHLHKALEVITIPHQDAVSFGHKQPIGAGEQTQLVESPYFNVVKWSIQGTVSLEQKHSFMLVSVLTGEGMMYQNQSLYELKKGDHFILPHGFGQFELTGSCEMIVSYL
ncbi:mannose-6-phosphate isomerase, class I [Caldalkalibacillus mannanilyticus]|uniref:mannose-6-phosphate isomerase, class I n=1 Tax=Caldalkalibacillus mannanilyticus TaxID=1418 RepID=UPI000469223D|nr:mannose-6-phosphate isomerase, class I [Caldalkalibacillus mannanilyticus]